MRSTRRRIAFNYAVEVTLTVDIDVAGLIDRNEKQNGVAL